jgi:hypothetical protein
MNAKTEVLLDNMAALMSTEPKKIIIESLAPPKDI